MFITSSTWSERRVAKKSLRNHRRLYLGRNLGAVDLGTGVWRHRTTPLRPPLLPPSPELAVSAVTIATGGMLHLHHSVR
jgi:hypothetical protein